MSHLLERTGRTILGAGTFQSIRHLAMLGIAVLMLSTCGPAVGPQVATPGADTLAAASIEPTHEPTLPPAAEPTAAPTLEPTAAPTLPPTPTPTPAPVPTATPIPVSEPQLLGTYPGIYIVRAAEDGRHLLVSIAETASDGTSTTVERLLTIDGTEVTSFPGGLDNCAIFGAGGSVVIQVLEGDIIIRDLFGEEVSRIADATNDCFNIRTSPRGDLLIIERDQAIRIYDLSGTLQLELAGDLAVFSPDQQRLLVWDFSGDANESILYAADGTELARLSGTGILRSGSGSRHFSPDSSMVLTVENNTTIHLWDRDGQPITSFAGYDAAFSPDGSSFAIRAGEGYSTTLHLADLSGQMLRTFTGGEPHDAVWFGFDPSGRFLLIWSNAGADGITPTLWSIEASEAVAQLGSGRATAEFSPAGGEMVTIHQEKGVRLWDLAGHELAALPGDDATFLPDGRLVVWSEETGATVIYSR
jgi:WD40 repeat protein